MVRELNQVEKQTLADLSWRIPASEIFSAFYLAARECQEAVEADEHIQMFRRSVPDSIWDAMEAWSYVGGAKYIDEGESGDAYDRSIVFDKNVLELIVDILVKLLEATQAAKEPERSRVVRGRTLRYSADGFEPR